MMGIGERAREHESVRSLIIYLHSTHDGYKGFDTIEVTCLVGNYNSKTTLL